MDVAAKGDCCPCRKVLFTVYVDLYRHSVSEIPLKK